MCYPEAEGSGVVGEKMINDAVQKELDLITKAIIEKVPVEEIYLFGSYAYGTPREDSDLDLYVVISDGDTDIIDTCASIRSALYKKGTLGLDLLMGKRSVFDRSKTSASLERVIFNQGIKIYAHQ